MTEYKLKKDVILSDRGLPRVFSGAGNGREGSRFQTAKCIYEKGPKSLSAVARYLLVLWACLAGCMIIPASAAEATFSLRIERGQVPKAMRVIRVKEGDFVRLLVSTDRPVTLHLHGYDIERQVKPGTVTEFAFKAYATGRFPINLHGQHAPSGAGAHEEVALLYIEVYPR